MNGEGELVFVDYNVLVDPEGREAMRWKFSERARILLFERVEGADAERASQALDLLRFVALSLGAPLVNYDELEEGLRARASEVDAVEGTSHETAGDVSFYVTDYVTGGRFELTLAVWKPGASA